MNNHEGGTALPSLDSTTPLMRGEETASAASDQEIKEIQKEMEAETERSTFTD